MVNKKLIKRVRAVIGVILAFSLLFTGYYLGKGITKNSYKYLENANNQNNSQTKSNYELAEEEISNFLVAYFTKKELGENRDRYKPYMTDGMYNATVAEEEKAYNKAYKGYIVDYEFQNAEIFINEYKKEALVNVKYKNTTLAIKDDRSKESTQINNSIYKITFAKSGDKLLVNKMEEIEIKAVERR